ncbi:hypothetical protein CSUI_005664, partial [Cystoisospora suis]
RDCGQFLLFLSPSKIHRNSPRGRNHSPGGGVRQAAASEGDFSERSAGDMLRDTSVFVYLSTST